MLATTKVRLVIVLMIGLLGTFGTNPAVAATGTVTFKNVGQQYLYVATSGDCQYGTNNATIVSLPPAQSTTVAAEGTICFVYSAYPTPLNAVWGGGRATPGETINIPNAPALLRVRTPDQQTSAEPPDSTVLVGASASGRAKMMAIALPGIQLMEAATAAAPATIERSVASWLDHTSRQSATDCVQEAIIDIPFDGQIRTCTGWRTRWRCPRNEAVLVVQTLDVARANQAIGNCLLTAGVVGAVAALSTAGGAAVAAAEAAFVVCLGDAAISSDIEIRGGWTDWGGC